MSYSKNSNRFIKFKGVKNAINFLREWWGPISPPLLKNG